jgi:transcriptional regulator with XRE-family HTH domain
MFAIANSPVMPKQSPERLGDKLRAIRECRGWTLDQMAEAVGRTEASRRARVYEWEEGIRQPDLPTLLVYAQICGVSTDVLIDDDAELNLEDREK